MRQVRLHILLFALALTASFQTALAQTQPMSRTSTQEINGHQLLVTVISKAIMMQGSAEPWWNWGNTTDSTYLFALDRAENVRFALVFTALKAGRRATLIYARKAQVPLPVRQSGTITALGDVSQYPHLVINTSARDWVVDGKVSYQLKLVGDGVAGQESITSTPDGTADYVREITPDKNGLPVRDESKVTQNPFPNRGYSRYSLTQRVVPGTDFQPWAPLMPTFPYLGAGQRRPDWFTSNPNPFYFNVSSGELQFFPFTGFQTGGMYGINSISVEKKNFENAFAFYPLRAVSAYADLVIRSKSFPAGDQFGPMPSALARTTFRYSWKTEDQELWTYSLGFAGQNMIVGDTSDQASVDRMYETLPDLVSTATWPAISFVQAMKGYTGSEGIYHYSAQDDLLWRSFQPNPPKSVILASPLFQLDSHLGPQAEHSLPLNFRGEYLFGTPRRVSLYQSDFDGLVHLKGAQEGFWFIKSTQYLYFSDLNRDGIMDSVQDCQTSDVVEVPEPSTTSVSRASVPRVCSSQLVRLGHSAVFIDGDKISVKAGLPPAVYSAVLVPTTADSWATSVAQTMRSKPVASTVVGLWNSLPGTDKVLTRRSSMTLALDTKTRRLTVTLRPVAGQATRVVIFDDGTAIVK